MVFALYPLRFEFRALDSVYFPAGKPGNILRGAFGVIFKRMTCVPGCVDVRTCPVRATCAYARIFEPAALAPGPSGLGDWPRPFVFRARHLDDALLEPGRRFHFDVHIFELRDPAIAGFVRAFAEIAREGLGPRRGRAVLERVTAVHAPECVIYPGEQNPEPLRLPLAPQGDAPPRVRVAFLTPTELKYGEDLAERPEFPILFARIRDRLSTLRALYGPGPLEIDYRSMAQRAAGVRMTRCAITRVEAERRSSRTGMVHPLGGFVGEAEYEGSLGEFLPYLTAAAWTGVGRQTVWGKGEIRVGG